MMQTINAPTVADTVAGLKGQRVDVLVRRRGELAMLHDVMIVMMPFHTVTFFGAARPGDMPPMIDAFLSDIQEVFQR